MMMVFPLAVLPELTASYTECDDICNGFNARSNNPDGDHKTF